MQLEIPMYISFAQRPSTYKRNNTKKVVRLYLSTQDAYRDEAQDD